MSILDPDELGKLTDMVQLLTELTVGYRQRLIAGGVPADTADEMTTEFHTMMMEQAKAGAATARKR